MIEIGALRVLEAAGLAGLRPSWCLLLVSAGMALGYLEPEGPLSLLGTWPAFAGLVVVAVVESALEREIEIEPFLIAVRVVTTSGAAVAASEAVAAETGADVTWVHTVGGVLIGLVVVLLRSAVRRQVKDYAEEAGSPGKWIARLEEGGLLLAVVLLVFSPVLLLILLMVFALSGAALFATAHLVDRRRRRDCPSCRHRARREALRCPGCQGRLEPVAWLAPPKRIDAWLAEWAGRPGESTSGAPVAGDEVPGGPPVELRDRRRPIASPVVGLVASGVLLLLCAALLVGVAV